MGSNNTGDEDGLPTGGGGRGTRSGCTGAKGPQYVLIEEEVFELAKVTHTYNRKMLL